MALTARLLLSLTEKPEMRVLLSSSIGLVLAVLACMTATLGNLAALGQTNLKRLLAYSTIAHAGYMMMALVALTPSAVGAILFYLIAYLLMNLGAFAVVAFLRNLTGSEELSSFSGLIQRTPILVVTLSIFLLSLLGLPPLAGFAAKFQIFASIYETAMFYRRDFLMMSYVFDGLLIVAAINTVISAAYYLKILRVMVLDRAGKRSCVAGWAGCSGLDLTTVGWGCDRRTGLESVNPGDELQHGFILSNETVRVDSHLRCKGNNSVMDSASQRRLQEIFRRESGSFLQYIHETTPWSLPKDKPLVAKMHQLATED